MAPDNEKMDCAFCNLDRVAAPEIQQYILQKYIEMEQEEDIRILFLIDRSGSMGRTTLPGLNDKSPLEILVAYIKNELKKLVTTNPKSKVGIILFNDVLKIIGDASVPPITIDDKQCLMDQAKLQNLMKENSKKMFSQPIEKSITRLIETIKDDDATNQTALGPAIVAGLELLKGGNSGSKMLIFTDGVANIGVGNLEEDSGPIDKKFYENAAAQARNEAIEISLYKISSQDCLMEVYLPLTSETYGTIMGINPALIAKEVDIKEKQADLARDAELTIKIPDIFKYVLVLDPLLLPSLNIFTKKYGRIVEDTNEILQFVLNPAAIAGKSVDKLVQVPFQLSLIHIGPDRKRYITVLTKSFKVKHDKKEKEFDPEIMHAYMNKLVQDGARNNKLPEVESSLEDLLASYISDASNPHAEGLIEYTKGLQKAIKPQIGMENQEEEKKKKEEKGGKTEEEKLTLAEKKKVTVHAATGLLPPVGRDGLIITTTQKYSKLFPKKK